MDTVKSLFPPAKRHTKAMEALSLTTLCLLRARCSGCQVLRLLMVHRAFLVTTARSRKFVGRTHRGVKEEPSTRRLRTFRWERCRQSVYIARVGRQLGDEARLSSSSRFTLVFLSRRFFCSLHASLVTKNDPVTYYSHQKGAQGNRHLFFVWIMMLTFTSARCGSSESSPKEGDSGPAPEKNLPLCPSIDAESGDNSPPPTDPLSSPPRQLCGDAVVALTAPANGLTSSNTVMLVPRPPPLPERDCLSPPLPPPPPLPSNPRPRPPRAGADWTEPRENPMVEASPPPSSMLESHRSCCLCRCWYSLRLM